MIFREAAMEGNRIFGLLNRNLSIVDPGEDLARMGARTLSVKSFS
jgi:hypothetical protein